MQTKSHTTYNASWMRPAIVISRYHREITTALLDGAREAFLDAGGANANLSIIDAPGTFELPVLAEAFAPAHDGIVTLGCVIAGETMHDRYISDAVANALQRIALRHRKPVAFGVLTCQYIEQAQARAGGDKGNKGAEAMNAVIQTLGVMNEHGLPGGTTP